MHRKFDKNAQLSNHLKTWESSVKIVDTFLNIAKDADHSRVYFFYLKVHSSAELKLTLLELFHHNILIETKLYFQNTHSYIKLLLQHGMASIESNLQRKLEDVHTFLGKLQRSTRFMHNLCCHSKVFYFSFEEFFSWSAIHRIEIFVLCSISKAIKDTAIVAMIPQLRETLSQLVYKVQGALVGNNCSSLFWAGNLKNKDLNGDEILSQVCTISSNVPRVEFISPIFILPYRFTGNVNYAKYIKWWSDV